MRNRVYLLMKENNILIDEDIFGYGYSIFLQYFSYFLIVIPIALITNELFGMICFLLLFVPLRRYLGGFHFKRKGFCPVFSVVFSIVILNLFHKIEVNITLGSLFFIFSIIICKLIAPIEHPKKKLDKNQKNIYNKKAIKVLISYFLIFLICRLLEIKLTNIIFITTIFSVINAVVGYICYNVLSGDFI